MSKICCTWLAGNTGSKKSPKLAVWAPTYNFVGLYLGNYGMYRQSEIKLLNSNVSPTCLHNMVNFGPLAAEICWRVWGTPANFNGFRVLASLLYGTVLVGVNQIAALNRGRIYILQGGHHVGHWPTFLVSLQTLLALNRAGCVVWQLECQTSNVTASVQSDFRLHGYTLTDFLPLINRKDGAVAQRVERWTCDQ